MLAILLALLPVLAGSGPVAVLPRRSFERWVEERTGFAAPLAEWQIQLAGSLAEAVEGVVLRQRRKIDELTGLLAEKERLLEQKDLLTREIDHRVKNSLQIVSAFLQMQRRQIADGEARQAFADTSARAKLLVAFLEMAAFGPADFLNPSTRAASAFHGPCTEYIQKLMKNGLPRFDWMNSPALPAIHRSMCSPCLPANSLSVTNFHGAR